ncbi:MAG: transcriptional regulator [Candidatus Thorarchaeota archaeon]
MTRARNQLIEEVSTQLEEAGFNLSSSCDVRPSCFDLVARRGEQLVLIKILNNIDALTKEDAQALQMVAQFFDAIPLVIGVKTRRGSLEPDIVYKRYGVPTITPVSLRRIIAEKDLPKEYVQRGGRFVAIDGSKLREIRTERRITQQELAECVQVSARAILAYEREEMDVSSDVAERLEKVLETDLIIPIDVLREKAQAQLTQAMPMDSISDLEKRVNEFFERLGMNVLWTDRAPFHVAAKEKGPPLMSGVGSLRSWALKKRVEIIKSVSKVTEANAVLIVEEGKSEECVSDVPVIRQLELAEIEKPRELKKIISERAEH